MTKTKTTKSALFASVLSLLLCVSMLIGSTFAWFTDSASTAVNSIRSGTIDIRLTDLEGNDMEGKTLNWVDAKGNSDILWEPGCTFITEPVRLWNYSNLSIALHTSVAGFTGDLKLLEAIEYKIAPYDEVYNEDGTMKEYDEIMVSYLAQFTEAYGGFPMTSWQYGMKDGQPTLLEDVCIVAHMKEDAGNEYQGLTLTGAALYFRAAQLADEYDSYDNRYDADADYDEVATNQDELNDAIANATEPTTVVLPQGEYKLPAMNNKEVTIVGTKDTVIDATANVASNGAALTFDGVTVVFDNDNYEGFQHSEKVVYKNCTIKGTQFLYADAEFINCTFKVTGDAYAVWTYGASNVIFTDCVFNTSGKAILVFTEAAHTATITVDGCTFNCDGTGYSKAAVEVGESAYGNQANYTIIIHDSTADDGFTSNNSSSNLWGNKNNMPADRLIVTVD